jgi:hypothetical protein
MTSALAAALFGASGALISFVAALWLGAVQNGGIIRKAFAEILPAMVVTTLAAIYYPFLNGIVLSVLLGIICSQCIQLIRNRLTQAIDRLWTLFFNWHRSPTKSDQPIRKAAPFAFPRPALFWIGISHNIGLTNAPDEEVRALQTYRAEAARPVPDSWLVFHLWLRERGKPFIILSLVGLVLETIATPIFEPLNQACFILLLFLLLPDVSTDASKPDASDAIRQLCYNWCAVWASWILLYSVFFVHALDPDITPFGGLSFGIDRRVIWLVLRNSLSNINTALVAVGFVSLKAILAPPFTTRRLPMFGRPTLYYFVALIVALVASLGEFLYYRHLSEEALRVALESDLFGWLGGFVGAVILALLVGQLQSRFIDAPTWLMAALYAYAIIQASFGAFEGSPTIKAIAFPTAFLLKCLLFLFVAWILESGLLLFHLEAELAGLRKRQVELKRFRGESTSD